MSENGTLACVFSALYGRHLSVEELDLEAATRNALERSGVHTLAQLLELTHEELTAAFPNRKLRCYEDVIHRLVRLSEEPKGMDSISEFECVTDISGVMGEIRRSDKKFNIFQVAKIWKSEEIHTSVIAELINPQSAFHDKGMAFLDKFLERIGAGPLSDEELSPDGLKSLKVETEVPTEQGRRIDMVIETKSRYLPFEVKIWAGDQKDQLRDYYEFANGRGKKVPKIYYLTPNGHEPSSWSCEEGADVPVQLLSFKDDILPWLKECINEPAVPLDVLEIMKQLHANMQGGPAYRPGIQGFTRWNGENDVLDAIYQGLLEYDLAWTECTGKYMTFTLNKREALEFALRIKKESENTARLSLICGIEGKDGRPDYTYAGDYITAHYGVFQALLDDTFEGGLKSKIKPSKSAWSRLPELSYKEFDAACCIEKIREILEELRPEISSKLKVR